MIVWQSESSATNQFARLDPDQGQGSRLPLICRHCSITDEGTTVKNSQWLPRINAAICNGCGECITTCPTGALQLRDGKAVLADPAACIYCATCETICPVGAIELPYLICIANQRGDNRL